MLSVNMLPWAEFGGKNCFEPWPGSETQTISHCICCLLGLLQGLGCGLKSNFCYKCALHHFLSQLVVDVKICSCLITWKVTAPKSNSKYKLTQSKCPSALKGTIAPKDPIRPRGTVAPDGPLGSLVPTDPGEPLDPKGLIGPNSEKSN